MLRVALPKAIQKAGNKTRRSLVKLQLALKGADKAERIHAERRLRGREQYQFLAQSDAVVVSFAKSGRTWLRAMISRLYQQIYDLPEDILIGFDNFHDMDSRIPRLFFTHDNYISDFTGHTDSKIDFYDKKVLLLMRDPRDVAVSQFFQWRFRMGAKNKLLNPYLPQNDDCTIYDFVTHKNGGMEHIIGFMNLWAKEMHHIRALDLLRYEDMRASPHQALTRMAQFLEIPATADQIEEAVEYASYENMKKKEADHSFRNSGGRMAPADRDNPDSYKVRRAKVGGYRDYFDDAQVLTIDRMMAETLDPVYGYKASETAETGTK